MCSGLAREVQMCLVKLSDQIGLHKRDRLWLD
jgi:hypothetical protein